MRRPTPAAGGATAPSHELEQELDDDTNSKKRRDDTHIMALMLIAFVLAAGYLYSFPDNYNTKTQQNSVLRGGLDSSQSRTSHSPTPSPVATRPSDLPVGCLWSIPELDEGKHIVKPPAGPVDLVCCQTTKGVWNIAVHPAWAPIGAENFENMVKTGFFDSKVALFRSLKGFLIQFGLAGKPSVQLEFEKSMLGGGKGSLPDDPPWLPQGPPGREINGVRRFQKGYLAYAGAGKNSRGTQLIVAFEDNLYLGGGSPWEVPWGQLVGEESFATLAKIYTGYGEKPSQGKIRNRGLEYTESELPLIDYITSCRLVREQVPWRSTIMYEYTAADPSLSSLPPSKE